MKPTIPEASHGVFRWFHTQSSRAQALTLGSKTEIWYFTSPETAKGSFDPAYRQAGSPKER
ncbi:MAG TPA: hypothetical protein ENK46_06770 [Flavobacteriia bacterium]|nr:hypothetical protein [Flavobacteriia bacterium]